MMQSKEEHEYLMLRDGDVIQEGDEFLNINGKWNKAPFIYSYSLLTWKNGMKPYRRPINVKIEDLY